MRKLNIPVDALINLYLEVADLCDASEARDGRDLPLDGLRKAYNRVFKTRWGFVTYSEACDISNARLEIETPSRR